MTLQDDINRLRDMFEYESAAYYSEVPQPKITIHKHTAYLPMSVEQQLDAGLITEAEARAQGWEPYVPPPTPWRSRLRWRWLAWRERMGRKVGGWIAGVDLSERDEDW